MLILILVFNIIYSQQRPTNNLSGGVRASKITAPTKALSNPYLVQSTPVAPSFLFNINFPNEIKNDPNLIKAVSPALSFNVPVLITGSFGIILVNENNEIIKLKDLKEPEKFDEFKKNNQNKQLYTIIIRTENAETLTYLIWLDKDENKINVLDSILNSLKTLGTVSVNGFEFENSKIIIKELERVLNINFKDSDFTKEFISIAALLNEDELNLVLNKINDLITNSTLSKKFIKDTISNLFKYFKEQDLLALINEINEITAINYTEKTAKDYFLNQFKYEFKPFNLRIYSHNNSFNDYISHNKAFSESIVKLNVILNDLTFEHRILIAKFLNEVFRSPIKEPKDLFFYTSTVYKDETFFENLVASLTFLLEKEPLDVLRYIKLYQELGLIKFISKATYLIFIKSLIDKGFNFQNIIDYFENLNKVKDYFFTNKHLYPIINRVLNSKHTENINNNDLVEYLISILDNNFLLNRFESFLHNQTTDYINLIDLISFHQNLLKEYLALNEQEKIQKLNTLNSQTIELRDTFLLFIKSKFNDDIFSNTLYNLLIDINASNILIKQLTEYINTSSNEELIYLKHFLINVVEYYKDSNLQELVLKTKPILFFEHVFDNDLNTLIAKDIAFRLLTNLFDLESKLRGPNSFKAYSPEILKEFNVQINKLPFDIRGIIVKFLDEQFYHKQYMPKDYFYYLGSNINEDIAFNLLLIELSYLFLDFKKLIYEINLYLNKYNLVNEICPISRRAFIYLLYANRDKSTDEIFNLIDKNLEIKREIIASGKKFLITLITHKYNKAYFDILGQILEVTDIKLKNKYLTDLNIFIDNFIKDHNFDKDKVLLEFEAKYESSGQNLSDFFKALNISN